MQKFVDERFHSFHRFIGNCEIFPAKFPYNNLYLYFKDKGLHLYIHKQYILNYTQEWIQEGVSELGGG